MSREAAAPLLRGCRGGAGPATWALMAVLAAWASGCSGSAHERAAQSGFGRLAGYIWNGSVTSVSATIVVPRVLPRSRAGLAATWIGAEATSEPGWFIQVGVNEYADSNGTAPFYEGFWSDRVQHFHPHFIYRVDAGDRLAASMQLISGRWHLRLKDLDSGKAWSVQTTEEAKGRFGLAEWFQENPTQGKEDVTAPYPALGPSEFRGLEVDRAPPPYATLLSQWLTADGVNVGPGPLRGESFALGVKGVTPAGRRYLAIAGREDLAETSFLRSMAKWSSTSPSSETRAACSAFARALRVNVAALSRTAWPSRERRLVAALIVPTRSLLALMTRSPASSAASLAAFRGRISAATLRLGAAAHRVRRALGLPQVASSPR